jgi:hypothetical protein
MAEKQFDLERMFEEIKSIYKKYGVSKNVGFVPDKLEIILERKDIDKFNLTYSEYFNYLPTHIQQIAIEQTIHLLQQIGITEKISIVDNGVKVKISGHFPIVMFPIAEMLIQNKNNGSEIKSILDSLHKNYQLFTSFFDFQWKWDDETDNTIKKLYKILSENPSISSEVDAIVKKYSLKK